MTEQFASPGTSSGIDWEALKGSLLVVEATAVETGIKTSFGDKDAVRATVSVLDGDSAGESYPDTLVFPSVLIGQLRSRIGQKVLGRLGQGNAKPGQKPPWLLQDATDADKQAAATWLSQQVVGAAPPF